jgi:hypothetical protein
VQYCVPNHDSQEAASFQAVLSVMAHTIIRLGGIFQLNVATFE